MKRLRFEYQMELVFSTPIREHYFTLRCFPKNSQRQRIQVEECRIAPADSTRELSDGFGNQKVTGCCHAPHDQFSCSISGTALAEGMKEIREPFHPMYRYPSPYTGHSPELVQFAKQFGALSGRGGARGREAIELGIRVMEAIYGQFRYEPGVTDIHTTAGQAFLGGCGVCQDYAHIMIAVLRILGVPARYVNGIMIGEGATHAWVEVYTGEGWYALDPTNCLHVDDYYIKFAHGRDYGDCVVDKGRFLGNACQEQKIYVNVEEIEK